MCESTGGRGGDRSDGARRSLRTPRGHQRIDKRASEWPARLNDLWDPPLALYHRGDWSLVELPAVAIVGARRASAVGREVARRLGRDLGAEGFVVVSGMARGIDDAAHRGALDVSGGTIAVLGTGIDRCYPAEQRDLYARLAREGLLLSEFEPGALPLRHHFPKRNRIIAALSKVVIIVEGGRRSGSRITADLALDLGREVMAVPRDPLTPGAETPNQLLREGAAPVTDARDVIAALDPSRQGGSRAATGTRCEAIPKRLAWLHEILGPSAMGAEELARISGRSVSEVLSTLLELELGGVVERAGAGLFRLRGEGGF